MDTLLSEYASFTEDFVFYELPIARALAYQAAINARYGNDQAGPNYEDQDIMDVISPSALGTRKKK